ncbi:unnamed protein product [Arctia plantaginis]|uniref:MBD domain-containing protein n=1 Tax=Arctia plantaginis TaxID=874455 RepID=A0A8S1AIG6_ARCPL|nr:unnamed protein product [Arctia plantaginis]
MIVTDGSRPSSALSTKSDGDGSTDASSAAYSPAGPGSRAGGAGGAGRRATTEMSSPLLRVPLERGWKRELVYRAALDAHSRRNADIYYYTPHGKKLRSTREVGEHLAGTGLTLENFSFFKEPLGVDDPEKEIIRDAKLIRRVDSPIAATTPATPVEGKRTPKPKAPKGASPEPQPAVTPAATTVKSPPAKIKQVKSVGSRLSASSGTPARKAAAAPAAPAAQPAPAAAAAAAATPATPAPPATPAATPAAPALDNNNSAAWKKPRPPAPPPLVSRPLDRDQHALDPQSPRQVVQPCSMTCGRGVPSLSCAACLCLYHAACAGYVHTAPPDPFLCKNCRKSSSPPLEPPPLTHKSGVAGAVPLVTPVPRRVPVPVPVPTKVPRDKRVLLRMKVSGGTPDGERVWAVSDQSQPQQNQSQLKSSQSAHSAQVVPPQSMQAMGRARGPRPSLPQSLAVLNGRRFIIVPRSLGNAQPQ